MLVWPLQSTCLPKTHAKGEQLKVPQLNEIKPMGHKNHLVTLILGSLGIRLSYRKKTLCSKILFLKRLHCLLLTYSVHGPHIPHCKVFRVAERNLTSRGLSSLGNSLPKNNYPTPQLRITVNKLKNGNISQSLIGMET